MQSFFAALVFAITGFFIMILPAWSQEEMVVFWESNVGKQVALKNLNTRGKLDLLTSSDDWHLYPDVSADGRFVAYVKGKDESDLMLSILDRHNQKEEMWSGARGVILHPRFSQNGDKIFFSMKTGEESKHQLAYLDLKSLRDQGNYSATPVVLADEHASYFPVAAADASFVVYQRNVKNEHGIERQIVMRSLVDQTIKIIDQGMAPTLSKDEKFIAYTKKVDGNWDIYVFDRMSKNIQRLTTHPDNDFAPVFDRKGILYFASNRLDVAKASYSIFKKEALQEESLFLHSDQASLYAPRLSGMQELKLENAARMTGTSRSSFGAIEHQGRIYVAGGHQGREHTYPPESFTNRVSYYDLKDKVWRETAARNHACHGFSLAAFGDYLFAFGGFAYEANNYPKWKSLDVIERYDIKKEIWEVIGQMPRRRSSNAVVSVNDRAYLLGGWDSTPKHHGDLNGTFHSTIDVFDLKEQKMLDEQIEMPKKRRAFSAVSRDGKIIMIGGISEGADHFDLLADVTEFDPASGTFRELTPLPFATFAPASGVLDDRIFVFGGMLKLGQWDYQYVSHIYQYEFKNNSWSHTGRYVQESKGFSQVVKWDDALGILGGHSYQNGQDAPLDSFEIFRINTSGDQPR